jgi:hypothetical protein
MTKDNAEKGVEVYFVVSYDPATGSFGIDDDRAEAVFGGEDVWNAEIEEWEVFTNTPKSSRTHARL